MSVQPIIALILTLVLLAAPAYLVTALLIVQRLRPVATQPASAFRAVARQAKLFLAQGPRIARPNAIVAASAFRSAEESHVVLPIMSLA